MLFYNPDLFTLSYNLLNFASTPLSPAQSRLDCRRSYLLGSGSRLFPYFTHYFFASRLKSCYLASSHVLRACLKTTPG